MIAKNLFASISCSIPYRQLCKSIDCTIDATQTYYYFFWRFCHLIDILHKKPKEHELTRRIELMPVHPAFFPDDLTCVISLYYLIRWNVTFILPFFEVFCDKVLDLLFAFDVFGSRGKIVGFSESCIRYRTGLLPECILSGAVLKLYCLDGIKTFLKNITWLWIPVGFLPTSEIWCTISTPNGGDGRLFTAVRTYKTVGTDCTFLCFSHFI